ncbi:MAG: hypothetical protein HYY49_07450 [Ignavibacteriales bacterium]|nr:hypothetical protein [Ignavibacteriales bacterium]
MTTKLIRIRNCADVAAHICENLDYKLNSRKCREIKKHIARCANCTAYLDSMKKTVKLYHLVPNPRVPSSARAKLYKVLKLAK